MSQKQEQRSTEWGQHIAQQEASKQSIREFCRQRGINEHSFYMWRQRLRQQAVRFALVETSTTASLNAQTIEIVLNGGERLRIPADAATLQLVLSVLEKRA